MNPLLLVLLAVDMGGAAHELARDVAAAAAHHPVNVTVRNISSLSPAETAEIRRVFESELKTAGQAEADIQLTISENLTQYILVAEINRSHERQVLLESWPRVPGASTEANDAAARVTLEKKLLWEQDQPILDAAQAGEMLVVLDATRVLLVQHGAQQSVAIHAPHAWPRDLLGRLSVGEAAFTAWLPGTLCVGNLQPRLSGECRASQDPWLLAPGVLASFAPNGNFFSGHIDVEPGGTHELAPFYSAAVAGDLWTFAGTDGHARVYTHNWEQDAEIHEWGSDIAAVQTPCGLRILATRIAGQGETDAIQPFELTNGAALAAGRALEFPGPVTALWSNGNAVTAISRDLQTGRYAAYSLAPACGA